MHNAKTIVKTTNPALLPPFKGIARPVIVSAVFFMLLTGIGYPLATTGVANLLFPDQAQGSLIVAGARAKVAA